MASWAAVVGGAWVGKNNMYIRIDTISTRTTLTNQGFHHLHPRTARNLFPALVGFVPPREYVRVYFGSVDDVLKFFLARSWCCSVWRRRMGGSGDTHFECISIIVFAYTIELQFRLLNYQKPDFFL